MFAYCRNPHHRVAELFEKARWEEKLEHILCPGLLASAQDKGVAGVAGDLAYIIAGIEQADAVLCACSTLGPLIEALGLRDMARINRPAMAVATIYRHVKLALCLESTRAPSIALYKICADGADAKVVMCAKAWLHFARGDTAAFYPDIAQTVDTAVIEAPQMDFIVFAQASMQGAAPLLLDIVVPVVTMPARRAIEIARR